MTPLLVDLSQQWDGRFAQEADEEYGLNVWQTMPAGTFECDVCLVPEDEGGYSAYLPHLPGVVSEGETLEDAAERIVEAFLGAVEVYKEQNKPIPWLEHAEETPDNAKVWRIIMNG